MKRNEFDFLLRKFLLGALYIYVVGVSCVSVFEDVTFFRRVNTPPICALALIKERKPQKL